MGHVLAFTNQKGGVGKTVSTVTIGTNLARRGAKVLLIDIDPQGNLTDSLGIEPFEVENTIYEVLLNPEHGVAPETIKTDAGVDLVPANLTLAGAENELARTFARELLLRQALTEARQEYDYVFIDPPPNLGLFTLCALTAADAAIVPVELGKHAYKAIPQLIATMEDVRKLNPGLALGGIFGTKAQLRTNLSQMIEHQLRAEYGETVFKTIIPQSTKIGEAPIAGTPLGTYAPGSAGEVAYAQLTTELEARYGWR